MEELSSKALRKVGSPSTQARAERVYPLKTLYTESDRTGFWVIQENLNGKFSPPCDVEKKKVEKFSKSFSSVIRLIRTEPTIPRQPTIPTLCLIIK